MPTSPHDPDRTARLTRRFPALAAVPERERLPLVLKARRQPMVLVVSFGLILLWLLLFGWQVIDLTGHVHGRGEMLTKLFFPVLVPFAAIFLIHQWLIQREIRRLVSRRPPPPPTAPGPGDDGSRAS